MLAPFVLIMCHASFLRKLSVFRYMIDEYDISGYVAQSMHHFSTSLLHVTVEYLVTYR